MLHTNLPPVLAEAISAHGYTELTAVQSAVLETEAIGRDLVVSAQTGSGKTVAFGAAMASDLLLADGLIADVSRIPLGLVIAPTRELALQVSRELSWLYRDAGVRIATCVGGMDPSKERRVLRDGAQIVVGTPGRLRDHLERGALDLSALRIIVLDEADEMLDMGFRDDLEEILDATPEERRTLLFSATMPPQIANLARRYQRDALRISTIGDTRGHGDIAYQAMSVSPAEIENAVVNLLRFHEAETAILFCATRDNVRRLHATLQERGFGVVALSGEHSQSERNQALQALRDKRARVCVATDVAARGIDLPSVTLVVHVEIPRDAETMQHRSGRTGRAGKKGTAVLIVPYPRRKRVEGMLRGARVTAEWINPPTAEAIRQQDRERLLAALLQPAEFEEEDREIAARVMEQRSPEDIAAAYVRMHRASLPQPEDFNEDTSAGYEAGRKDRHREGFEDIVWYRMDIGRRQNADARWILPLLCRRGHITRNEIGAIRIAANESYFQIPRAIAEKFNAAVQRTAGGAEDGSDVMIEASAVPPRDTARENRRFGKGGDNAGNKPQGRFDRGGERGNDRGDRPGKSFVRKDGPPKGGFGKGGPRKGGFGKGPKPRRPD